VISNDREDMEYTVKKLMEKRWGLTVNIQKTNCIFMHGAEKKSGYGRQERSPNLKELKYLGITLNREGIDDKEINNRITKARIIACLNGKSGVRASRKRRYLTSRKQW
jgi:hypothetical protein